MEDGKEHPAVGAQPFEVFDVLGRSVKNLVNENLRAGVYEINFEASELNSGSYFYKLSATNFNETKKMILIK